MNNIRELVFEVVLKCLSVDLDEVKRYTVPRAALTCLGNNVPVFAAQTPALVGGEPAPSAPACPGLGRAASQLPRSLAL